MSAKHPAGDKKNKQVCQYNYTTYMHDHHRAFLVSLQLDTKLQKARRKSILETLPVIYFSAELQNLHPSMILCLQCVIQDFFFFFF